MKESMNRRDFIEVGTAATAGLVYHSVDESVHPIENGILDPKIKSEIAKFKEVFTQHEALSYLAQKEVIGGGGLARHSYIHEYFKNHKSKYIPTEVQSYIANLIPGLAAEESKYHNGLESPNGAFGILQIMPETYFDTTTIDKDELKDLKSSLVKQTAFCFKYLDEKVYKYLNESENAVPLKDVCSQFKLDEKESNIFCALVTINAYNAGQGNMMKIVKKFKESYPSVSDLSKSYNGTGLSLFYILMNTALKKDFCDKEPVTTSYGIHARNYVLKILAGSDALNDKLKTSYGLEFDDSSGIKNKSSTQKTVEAGIAGMSAGILANSVMNQLEKNKNTDDGGSKSTRGQFLRRIAVSAVSGIVGSKIPSMLGHDKNEEKENTDKKNYFPDGTIYDSVYVQNKLDDFYKYQNKFFSNENFKGDIIGTNKNVKKELPIKNFTSSGFKDWFINSENEGDIVRYNSQKEIIDATEDGTLSMVPEANYLWRCYNVKGGHENIKGPNHPSYLAFRPEAFDVLKQIGNKFQENIVRAGIDTTSWKVRFKIESLVRDMQMSNGSDYSPHEFGLGIDFPKKKAFDLIYVPDNTFMVLDEEKNKLLYKAVETIFIKTLQEVSNKNNDKVLVTNELSPSHFHVAVRE